MNDSNLAGVFIEYLDSSSPESAIAVKDIIDVQGIRTTAGCEVIAAVAEPAAQDADCIEPIRKAGLTIAGKTNLAEIAFGTTGRNTWSGTPENPLGRDLIPGGSSSGSAVAVARGECKFALGTDTGGSVRIPSACCGIAGLKPTFGTISVSGVRPLAPSMDVVGPMARSAHGLTEAFSILTETAEPEESAEVAVSRLKLGGVDVEIEQAISRALNAAELRVVPSRISEKEWNDAVSAADHILWAEAADANRYMFDKWDLMQNGEKLHQADQIGADLKSAKVAAQQRGYWIDHLRNSIQGDGFLVTPGLECFTPTFRDVDTKEIKMARFTIPVNLAGFPSVVIPLPVNGSLPASLQIIGPENSEYQLLKIARRIEESIR